MIKKILNYIRNWIWVREDVKSTEEKYLDVIEKYSNLSGKYSDLVDCKFDVKPVLDRPEVVRNLWKERYEAKMKEMDGLWVFGESSTEEYGEAFDRGIPKKIMNNLCEEQYYSDQVKCEIDQMIREL